MSDHEFSSPALALGLVVGPIVALANQLGMYMANVWACGHGVRASLHSIPILALIVTAVAARQSHRVWRSGDGAPGESARLGDRKRFLATVGFALTLFSVIAILAEWVTAFMFEPCMRR